MLHCFRLLYFSKTCLKEMWSFAHEQNIPASHKNVPEYLEYTQNSVRMFGMHFDYQGMYHGFSFRLHSGARVTRVLATGDVDWRTSSAALAVRETNTAGSRGSLERAIRPWVPSCHYTVANTATFLSFTLAEARRSQTTCSMWTW